MLFLKFTSQRHQFGNVLENAIKHLEHGGPMAVWQNGSVKFNAKTQHETAALVTSWKGDLFCLIESGRREGVKNSIGRNFHSKWCCRNQKVWGDRRYTPGAVSFLKSTVILKRWLYAILFGNSTQNDSCFQSSTEIQIIPCEMNSGLVWLFFFSFFFGMYIFLGQFVLFLLHFLSV